MDVLVLGLQLAKEHQEHRPAHIESTQERSYQCKDYE